MGEGCSYAPYFCLDCVILSKIFFCVEAAVLHPAPSPPLNFSLDFALKLPFIYRIWIYENRIESVIYGRESFTKLSFEIADFEFS